MAEPCMNLEMNLHDSCFIFMQESVKINKQDLDNILDGFLPRTCQGLLVGEERGIPEM